MVTMMPKKRTQARLRPDSYRKLERLARLRKQSMTQILEDAINRELAALANEARKTPASSDQPALAGLPQ